MRSRLEREFNEEERDYQERRGRIWLTNRDFARSHDYFDAKLDDSLRHVYFHF